MPNVNHPAKRRGIRDENGPEAIETKEERSKHQFRVYYVLLVFQMKVLKKL